MSNELSAMAKVMLPELENEMHAVLQLTDRNLTCFKA